VAAPLAAGYRYAPGGLAARRFPLAPRPKPPCRPLTERLARVARLAGQVEDDADAPLRAAGACNLAALIASDCAMPDLARALCWAQFDAYQAARPATCAAPDSGDSLIMHWRVDMSAVPLLLIDGHNLLFRAWYVL
jgi:hypothetical protein